MKKKPTISQEEFRQQYNGRKPQYERLATNLQQALKAFLEEKNIPYLEVLTRVKDGESAYEKVARKGYEQPFEQIEDWCGLRIICYYPSDIDLICEVLKQEFDIQTQEDTSQRLASNEFGYRSTHLILQVKPTWAVTPNYRGLQDLKAEVQVRTILMHAWAEIEHKLAYKNAEQAPDQFRRKLSRLSAKFEEADEQFEELRNGILNYRETIRATVRTPASFRTQELNLDTLQAFLDVTFPDRRPNLDTLSKVNDELTLLEMNLKDVVDSWEISKDSLNAIEENPEFDFFSHLTQVGLLRLILEIGSEKYHNFRKLPMKPSIWTNLVDNIRVALHKKPKGS